MSTDDDLIRDAMNTVTATSAAIICGQCGGYKQLGAWYGTIPPKLCYCPSTPRALPYGAMGWTCPQCGTSHAPWVASCSCHWNRAPFTITYGPTS
jgi:hypothetical protein